MSLRAAVISTSSTVAYGHIAPRTVKLVAGHYLRLCAFVLGLSRNTVGMLFVPARKNEEVQCNVW